jgi:septation ring formation regulator EzrA
MLLLILCLLLVVIAVFSIIQHLRTRKRNQLGAARKTRRR